MFLALAGALVVFATAAAAQATFPEEISLPNGFRPEGIAIGNGATFYVGSIPTGAVYRGDLRTGDGAVLVPAAPGRASIGMKFDRGLLYVAGGGTGKGFVYDTETGTLELEVQLATGPGATFVNDVVVTRDAAYFTDSQRPALYRLPLANDGSPGDAATVVPIAGGGFTQVPGANNLNGIDATPDGKTLVVVQTVTGRLFRIDAATGETTEIDLGGDTVVNGDGILLARTDALRRPEPLEPDRGRLARPGPRLGVGDGDHHQRRVRRADHDRPVRQPPVRGQREVRHGRADARTRRRTRSSRSTADPRAGRPAAGRAPRLPRAGRLGPVELEAYQLVILRRPPTAPDLDEETLDRIQAEHLDYLGSLRAAGRIVTNGPVLDQQDESLRGLVFYCVGSVEEARALAERDPAVAAGRLAVEAMTWWCPAGSMTVPGRPVRLDGD